jgi:CubicO group peptidase (beta-lactamase class C family)
MIGSITKPMTTMLAAALVDGGRLSWGTRLVDVLPRSPPGIAQ